MPNPTQTMQAAPQNTESEIQRSLPTIADRFSDVIERLARYATTDPVSNACKVAQAARPAGAPISGHFVGTIDLTHAAQGLAYISVADHRFPFPLTISIAHHPALNQAKNGAKFALSLDEFGRVSSIHAAEPDRESQPTLGKVAELGDVVF